MDDKIIKILDSAIKLHEKHMVNPKTATESSQKILMNMIKKARRLMDNE